jgi:hypothetical protein
MAKKSKKVKKASAGKPLTGKPRVSRGVRVTVTRAGATQNLTV